MTCNDYGNSSSNNNEDSNVVDSEPLWTSASYWLKRPAGSLQDELVDEKSALFTAASLESELAMTTAMRQSRAATRQSRTKSISPAPALRRASRSPPPSAFRHRSPTRNIAARGSEE